MSAEIGSRIYNEEVVWASGRFAVTRYANYSAGKFSRFSKVRQWGAWLAFRGGWQRIGGSNKDAVELIDLCERAQEER